MARGPLPCQRHWWTVSTRTLNISASSSAVSSGSICIPSAWVATTNNR